MTMKHKPRTRQRSQWVRHDDEEVIPGAGLAQIWQRNVHDGHLTAIVAEEPGIGWHLSISHRTNTHPPKPGRYPSWDEIVHARDLMLPADTAFIMRLPAAGDFVSFHDTTFHLYELPQ